MMEKYFVTYEQALALKELGFKEICLARFLKVGDEKEVFMYFITPSNENNDITVIAPLKSQVFEWFRKQGYDTKVQKESEGLYFGFYWTGAAWIIVGNGSYEESESACIDKLIKIVKDGRKIN